MAVIKTIYESGFDKLSINDEYGSDILMSGALTHPRVNSENSYDYMFAVDILIKSSYMTVNENNFHNVLAELEETMVDVFNYASFIKSFSYPIIGFAPRKVMEDLKPEIIEGLMIDRASMTKQDAFSSFLNCKEEWRRIVVFVKFNIHQNALKKPAVFFDCLTRFVFNVLGNDDTYCSINGEFTLNQHKLYRAGYMGYTYTVSEKFDCYDLNDYFNYIKEIFEFSIDRIPARTLISIYNNVFEAIPKFIITAYIEQDYIDDVTYSTRYDNKLDYIIVKMDKCDELYLKPSVHIPIKEKIAKMDFADVDKLIISVNREKKDIDDVNVKLDSEHTVGTLPPITIMYKEWPDSTFVGDLSAVDTPEIIIHLPKNTPNNKTPQFKKGPSTNLMIIKDLGNRFSIN